MAYFASEINTILRQKQTQRRGHSGRGDGRWRPQASNACRPYEPEPKKAPILKTVRPPGKSTWQSLGAKRAQTTMTLLKDQLGDQLKDHTTSRGPMAYVAKTRHLSLQGRWLHADGPASKVSPATAEMCHRERRLCAHNDTACGSKKKGIGSRRHPPRVQKASGQGTHRDTAPIG